MGRPLLTLKERLERKIDRSVDGCWEWQGHKNYFGYGTIQSGGKVHKAHRVAWQTYRGAIPRGMFVCHRCDNPPCCNPDHLFLGTCKDNTHDAIQKRRFAPPGQRKESALKFAVRGDTHCCAKVKSEHVRLIRRLITEGVRISDIAKEYNVHVNTIYDIQKNRTWRHVS